jgi:hypothetical protein
MRAITIVLAAVVSAVFAATCFAAPLIVEKNLFAMDRKPPSPEAAAPAPQQNKPGLSHTQLQLDGVIIHGNSRKAIVRTKAMLPPTPGAKKPQSPFVTVREGQQIGEYKVVKIETKSISLEKDGQTFVIGLFAEGKVAPPAPPVPTVQPQQPGQEGGAPPAAPGQPGAPVQPAVHGQVPPAQAPPPVQIGAPVVPAPLAEPAAPPLELDPSESEGPVEEEAPAE